MPKNLLSINEFLSSQPARNQKHLKSRIAKCLLLDPDGNISDYHRLRAIIIGNTTVPPLYRKLINEEFGIDFHYPDPAPAKRIQPVTADKDYREGVEL